MTKNKEARCRPALIPVPNSKVAPIVGLAAAAAFAVPVYVFLVRPWHLRWGASEAEVAKFLPGDDLVPQPKVSATHAITIQAPISKVWPWLVQLGQGRGGFYSYDWLENLFGCDIHNADRLLPQYQNLKAGDGIRIHPRMPAIPVVAVEPGRVIVLHSDTRAGSFGAESSVGAMKLKPGDYMATTWVFFLERVDAHTTRLIERFRLDSNPKLVFTLANRCLLEPASFIMERKMLLGIKQRVERGRS